MSAARLVGGWLLLCSLSAGGAYFAMDEVDRRIDLGKYDLRAKVGLSPSPLPSPTPALGGGGSSAPTVAPPSTPVPDPNANQGRGGAPPVQPPVVPPPSPAPSGPPGGGSRYPRGQTPAPVPQPVQPGGTGQTGGNQRPAPINPPGGQTQPTPPPQNPTQPNPTPPTPTPAAPDPNAGQIARPDPRTTDLWKSLRSTYDQMSPRSEAVLGSMEQIKRQTQQNRGVFRTDLQTAMISLRDSMNNAKRALDAGDTDSARNYLATAYQQLTILEQSRH